MVNLVGYLNPVYQGVGEIANTTKKTIAGTIHRIKDSAAHTYHLVGESCRDAAHAVSHKVKTVANKVANFVLNNKAKFLFAGATVATAFFAPQLFFSAFVVTVILRVEFAHLFKKGLSYLKDEYNPYKYNPEFWRYQKCANTLEMTTATIAALDAIALGTFFVANCFTVAMVPALGGIAAGSAAAKIAMNLTRFLKEKTQPNQVID
jgi:hypothetical protein